MSDAFESEYMAGDASVRHRDKRVSRGMALILGVPALFTWFMAIFVAVTNATSDKPVPAAALPFVVAAMGLLGCLFVFLSLSFAVLRTAVTDRAVIVKYGLFGPEIDLASITSCRVLDYEWTKFGGWGIRRGVGGVWAYVPGPGKVVELTYQEGAEEKRVQIGARDAIALAREIDSARQALAGARIAIDDERALGEEEALAEAEQAEQEAAAERSERH